MFPSLRCSQGAGLPHSNLKASAGTQHNPATPRPYWKGFCPLSPKGTIWGQRSQALNSSAEGGEAQCSNKRRPSFCPGKCCPPLPDLPPQGHQQHWRGEDGEKHAHLHPKHPGARQKPSQKLFPG